MELLVLHLFFTYFIFFTMLPIASSLMLQDATSKMTEIIEDKFGKQVLIKDYILQFYSGKFYRTSDGK